MIPMYAQNIISIILICAAVWLYLMPSIEAHKAGHHNRRAITVLNVLAGWTFAGWVAAYVWAHTKIKYEGRDL